jgi:hypothetical protein
MIVSTPTTVSAPPGLSGKIVEELAASLPQNERELLDIIGLSEFLCCQSVARRERAAGRVSATQEQAERVAGLVNSMGLYCHRSALDHLPQPDLIGGNVKHYAVYVPQGSHEDAFAVLYFGLDAEFAAGAESAELNKNQALVGRLFGYPECCSEFFLRNDGVNQDRTPASIPDAGPFPSILNPLAAELYGFRLPFHFACSPRCPQTLAIARKRFDYLLQRAPSLSTFEELGAGLAFYGPETGAALATRYRQTGADTYEVDEVLTRSDAAAALFSGGREATPVRLHSAHEFEVAGRRFDDGRHFAAVFTHAGGARQASASSGEGRDDD